MPHASLRRVDVAVPRRAARPGTPRRSRRSSRARCGSRARCETCHSTSGRVLAVPLGHRPAQPQRVLAVDRRARAEGLPAARPQRASRRRVTGSISGWRCGQPRRRRRGRGGEVDARCRPACSRSSTSSSQSEVESPAARLEAGPREDAQRDQVDAGLAHQLDVLVLDVRGPLLGVVVTAEGQGGPGRRHGDNCPDSRSLRVNDIDHDSGDRVETGANCDRICR